MVNQDAGDKVVPVAAGVAIGVLVFAGLNLWFGQPFIPSVQDLPTYPKANLPSPTAAAMAAATPSGPTDPGAQTFQTVCAACHQADAKGLAGAFPPLAGSHWASDDPETPVRIVLAGLTGPIEVEGQKFASLMPPPAGLDDEKIAAVLTYVRSNFGNKASAISKEQVAAVRASLAGRATPWTADELTVLRPHAAAAPTPANPIPVAPAQP